MKKFNYVVLSLVVLGILACVLTGCGGGSSSDTLKFGCINYSDSLDPSTQVNSAWANSRYGIGECLFRFDDEMNANPYLADSIESDDAKTTWTVHLKDGVKFSNGDDMTATAVKLSIERMYENEAAGNGSTTPSTFMTYDSITADDSAGTVTIKTQKAYPDLAKILAAPYFVIMDVEATEDMATKPIGTGPYAVDSINEGSSIHMVRNENYWQGEVPYANLDIIFITDNATKALSLENGDVDVVENITSSTELEKFENNADYNVSITSSARTGFAYMNAKGILSNETLRKAIVMAIDDKSICENTVGGIYTYGFGILPTNLGYGGDELTNATPYDPEAAKKLLDDAGIKDTNNDGGRELNGQEINLNYLTYDSRNMTDFAEADVAALEDIGIKATIQATDADTEWDKMVAGEYDFCSSNWLTTPIGEPTEFLANWYGPGTANYCGFNDAQYNSLYEQLQNSLNEDNTDTVKQMQQILVDKAAALVYGYYNSNMCSRKSVTGADISTADYYWITYNIKPA